MLIYKYIASPHLDNFHFHKLGRKERKKERKKDMLQPSSPKNGRSTTTSDDQNNGDNLVSKLNVNEEYMEAFRTKSYTEMWSKVQVELRRTNQERLNSFTAYSRISENLLEPNQEIVINLIKKSSSSDHVHRLLVEYFEGSLKACKICGFLLQVIHQTRVHYCTIQRVIRLTKRVPEFGDGVDEQCKVLFDELESFAKVDNPLTSSSRVEYNVIHDGYRLLLYNLMKTNKKIAKKAKIVHLCKRGLGVGLVTACVTLTTVTVVLAIHSLVGIVAVPGLVTVPLVTIRRQFKSAQTSALTRIVATLDAAAKGVYILERDFDTLSQLVTKLHDEIERRRSIANLCVNSQKRKMLKEVVKEFKIHEPSFLELLGELEEHVYLCFLTINRARRLVMQAMMEDDQQHN